MKLVFIFLCLLSFIVAAENFTHDASAEFTGETDMVSLIIIFVVVGILAIIVLGSIIYLIYLRYHNRQEFDLRIKRVCLF